MEIKSGWKTSEFWVAVLPYVGQLVVVILFALGYIPEDLFAILMGSGFLGGAYAAKGYAQSRAEVKSQYDWNIRSAKASETTVG